jgi:hypothetical protein
MDKKSEMPKKGIESFKDAVMKDCKQYNDCFNETGCDHEFIRMVPQDNPELLKMGMNQSCISVSKCSHKYCDKYKWVIDRAQEYAEKTGTTKEKILEVWETNRSYWYMNYYQGCNQPSLKDNNNVIMYEDWIIELERRFGKDPKKWVFVCPNCKGKQSLQDFLDAKVENPDSKVFFSCIGRYVKGRGCDWTLGGLLKVHTTTVIKNGQPHPVFEMATI